MFLIWQLHCSIPLLYSVETERELKVLHLHPYSAEQREIARDILRYLEKHPESKDTLNGIVQWWLLREWRERKLAEIEAAVSFLVSSDLVLEMRRTGMPPYYQLNSQKQEEISKMLEIG